MSTCSGQIKILVFNVTRPYLNVLVNPRIFRFSGEFFFIISCILKGEMPFKIIELHIFSEKKYVCLPSLKFSDLLPETHLFFIWPYKCTMSTLYYI